VSQVETRAARVLERAGLRGSVLARDLGSGLELSVQADLPVPLASLVKLPLAAAVLAAAAAGELDLAALVTIDADRRSRGGPGLARFRHPATLAVEDLVTMAVELSDNSAADALFELVPPAAVTGWLQSVGIRDVIVRHPVETLYASLALRLEEHDAAAVAALVVAADAEGLPSPLPELDPERANVGTARALADLLALVWGDDLDPRVSARLRTALGGNVHRQRLAPDFAADASTWSSKTGSFVHLRHEAGVVEHRTGEAVAVVALTASSLPAVQQPVAEQAMGEAARLLHDEVLRQRPIA
jgi:beta-lactamase class A